MSLQRRTIDGHSRRWDADLADDAYRQGQWVKDTLAEQLARTAAEAPNTVLVVDDQRQLSAADLYKHASGLARTLASRYSPGSVVSFMLPNWHEAAIIYLGATMAGMVAHPVLPSLREHDLAFMLKDVDSRIIFIPQQFRGQAHAEMLASIVKTLPSPPDVVVVRGDGSQHESHTDLLDAHPPGELPALDSDAVRMIMYTSGTTGRPKGVMHSHNSIHALIQQLGQHWLIEPGDSFLVASPISHIGGSIYAFEIPILLGATAVLMERWDASDAVNTLATRRCTHFAGATPFLSQLLDAAQQAGTRLPDLKVFICGGASVPPTLIREAREYFQQARVTRVYGSTEVPVMSVGVVEPYDVHYASETDGRPGIANLELSDRGEVLAKGPQMLVGYHHAEDEEGAFDERGFFRTGDLARWIDGDYLVIAGRLKDIIIRHGENIAPKEIEDLLIKHPAIADIAIVGLPDQRTGERACAVIVAAPQEAPGLEDIRDYLNELGVAKFKIPEQVALWEALPKNDAGKVLKHQIRATLLEQ
ncbi:AMP-binding protein [Spongiibacter nanhainus]|uniref:AMP-binding protein n=1 Tax=Spongiibacter nanhainus TaxID=2794344 RepID=A0A7T4QYU2_9GAMM|nr:AMP-binding protein [Spongiibacter nanhainus]QQD17290.1 AMP-binding protein [Spongiibacter nanhainus]